MSNRTQPRSARQRPLSSDEFSGDQYDDRDRSRAKRRSARRESAGGSRFGLGFVVFIGTLLGSLIGFAADAGEAADTLERFRRAFYPELCVAGSNTILGEGITMAADWAAAFESEHDVRVRIEGVGSVRGVQNAINGECVHVLAMSEPMSVNQYNALRGADIEIDCAAEIGYDVIAFVTDIDNKLPALLSRNLSSILRGQINTWETVGGEPGPIRVLARPGSGTTEVVLRNIAGWEDDNLSDQQYFPPGTAYLPCRSNDECLDRTLATPGSLYWVSTAWMRTQPTEFIRIMPILRGDERPINPLTQTVDLDEYPSQLIRPLYLYVLSSDRLSDELEALAREFLFFVRSVPGQVIVENHHFYTFFKRPENVEVQMPPGFEAPEGGIRPTCRSSAGGASS